MKRPYGEEISGHFEQELREGLSGRFSYVYKNIRNEWAEVDLARVDAQTVERNVVDRGPDGILGNADDTQRTLYDIPAGTGTQRFFTNPDDPSYDSDYSTVEMAINRRFRGGWMLLTSFDYTWLKEFVGVGSTTSVLSSAGNTKAYSWNRNLRQADRETTTVWNYKLIGRYTLPADRHQRLVQAAERSPVGPIREPRGDACPQFGQPDGAGRAGDSEPRAQRPHRGSAARQVLPVQKQVRSADRDGRCLQPAQRRDANRVPNAVWQRRGR